MISRVLVPMDESDMATTALEYALDVFPDADITVLHVVGEPSSMMGKAVGLAMADDLEHAAHEHAENVFATARDRAAAHGVEITTKVAVGHPARAIVNRADAFDMIVIGSHSGTLSDRLLVGNVAETVFRRSPVPVTVVR